MSSGSLKVISRMMSQKPPRTTFQQFVTVTWSIFAIAGRYSLVMKSPYLSFMSGLRS
ncbi:MAG: hypothetical protein A4E61_01015 [Syntrophorhabdus sp. PtaB.Bin184]|nr:MAG: hypothetical protein A4E61_01015 [Syntrophorhabdus sp. PtaB.Bin184]